MYEVNVVAMTGLEPAEIAPSMQRVCQLHHIAIKWWERQDSNLR